MNARRLRGGVFVMILVLTSMVFADWQPGDKNGTGQANAVSTGGTTSNWFITNIECTTGLIDAFVSTTTSTCITSKDGTLGTTYDKTQIDRATGQQQPIDEHIYHKWYRPRTGGSKSLRVETKFVPDLDGLAKWVENPNDPTDLSWWFKPDAQVDQNQPFMQYFDPSNGAWKSFSAVTFKTHDNGDDDIEDNYAYLHSKPRPNGFIFPPPPGKVRPKTDGHSGHMRGAFDLRKAVKFPTGKKRNNQMRIAFPFSLEASGDVDLVKVEMWKEGIKGTIKSWLEMTEYHDSDRNWPDDDVFDD